REPMITDHPLQEQLRQPGIVAGTMVFEFFTPGIGYILKNAGADFAVFDMEHTGIGFGELRWVMRGCEAAGLAAIVRVPTSRPDHIARALDIGADGIMVPMVESAREAEEIAAAAKYPPTGKRGVAQQIGHDRYAVVPMRENMQDGNANTTVIVQIETTAGVDAAAEIAAVDGVDALWLGHGDLSGSLGAPGDFASDAFRRSVDTILAAGKAAEKRVGRLVPDRAAADEAITAGFDILLISADIKLLYGAMKQALDGLSSADG
ncbi:MAG: aldolase/citrate lyase family protein, partial [Pseudomonadota bacterium]